MRVDVRSFAGTRLGSVKAFQTVVVGGGHGPEVAYLGDCVPIYRLSGPTRWGRIVTPHTYRAESSSTGLIVPVQPGRSFEKGEIR